MNYNKTNSRVCRSHPESKESQNKLKDMTSRAHPKANWSAWLRFFRLDGLDERQDGRVWIDNSRDVRLTLSISACLRHIESINLLRCHVKSGRNSTRVRFVIGGNGWKTKVPTKKGNAIKEGENVNSGEERNRKRGNVRNNRRKQNEKELKTGTLKQENRPLTIDTTENMEEGRRNTAQREGERHNPCGSISVLPHGAQWKADRARGN